MLTRYCCFVGLLFTLLTGVFDCTQAQVVFWSENFGTGCSPGNLASNTSTANGTWLVTFTGANDPEANQFYISATEAGMGVNNCGDGCLGNSSLVNRTLHVANVSTSPSAIFFCPSGDCGAAYDAGGGCAFGLGCVATDKRAESPLVNCVGQSNISLSFLYFEGPNAPSDNATVWYFDGANWTQLADPPATPLGPCAPQGRWTAFTVNLPASANGNPGIRIGFRWRNNDDGAGTDPSFAVDDLELRGANCVVIGTSLTASACNSYTAPWGTTYSQSGSFSDTLTAVNGCDSIVTVNLTITGTIVTPPVTASACSSYTAPWGTVYTQSGTYSDTLNTVNGCDSIVSVNLTITGTIVTPPVTASACSSYLAPWGTVYTQSGTYSDTLNTVNGCDSVITVNLTITGVILTPPTTAFACSSYTAPWGATYSQSGIYSDTLTTLNGCDSIVSVNLTITGTIMTPPINASACSSYTAPWGATYSQSGIYSDTLTTLNGCDSIVSVNLTITGTIVTPPINASACSSYTAPWGATYSQSGTYSDTLSTVNGCDSIVSVNLTITGAIVMPSITASACSSYTASWGTTYTQSGTYSDTLSTVNGCDSIVSVELTISGAPTVLANTTVDSCARGTGSAQIIATGGSGVYSFLWSDGSTGSTLPGLAAGVYTVTVSDANACTSVSSITISGTPATQVTVTPAFISINEGDSVLLTAAGGNVYVWSPSIGLSCTTCANPVAAPSQTTTYTVTGSDANGCSDIATLTVEVKVDIVCSEVFIPSIFSPNNAGPQNNEEVCVFGNCIAEMDFAIYDRWGQLVFQTKDPAVCWDGTKNGKVVMTGQYSYRLRVEQTDGQQVSKSGSILLTR